MVTRERWENAQEYEAGFWDSAAQRIETGDSAELEWYGWRSEQLQERLVDLDLGGLTVGESVVLEVGSGPVGVVSFFPAALKIAVDPLQSFYSSQQALTSPRSEDVIYVEGIGEALSLANASCDLVIIENCIDHVQSVDAVINELTRVLRPGGILYLTVNCRSGPGYYVHRILSKLQFDPGHPHTFTRSRIEDLIDSHGYDVIWTDTESYLEATLSDLKDRGIRSMAKAFLGISEFTASIIAMRRGSRCTPGGFRSERS